MRTCPRARVCVSCMRSCVCVRVCRCTAVYMCVCARARVCLSVYFYVKLKCYPSETAAADASYGR